MPGLTGPLPKDTPQQRQRDQNRRVDARSLIVTEHENFIGPPLPKRADGEAWRPQTKEWYDSWRLSAQATVFVGTDWKRLQMLAYVVDEFYGVPDIKLLSEIRQNETHLGATLADRIRLRMQINRPDPSQVNAVNSRPSVADLTKRI